MQNQAFTVAGKGLAGVLASTDEDPVAAHFNPACGSLQGGDLTTIRAMLKALWWGLEFQQSFMVAGAEAVEGKKLAGAAKAGDRYDFGELAPKPPTGSTPPAPPSTPRSAPPCRIWP